MSLLPQVTPKERDFLAFLLRCFKTREFRREGNPHLEHAEETLKSLYGKGAVGADADVWWVTDEGRVVIERWRRSLRNSRPTEAMKRVMNALDEALQNSEGAPVRRHEFAELTDGATLIALEEREWIVVDRKTESGMGGNPDLYEYTLTAAGYSAKLRKLK